MNTPSTLSPARHLRRYPASTCELSRSTSKPVTGGLRLAPPFAHAAVMPLRIADTSPGRCPGSFVSISSLALEGELEVPPNASGVVIFAHGGGSTRHSPRNQLVARVLREAGVGTLQFDLLTPKEKREDAMTGALRFDPDFLAQRLISATRWIQEHWRTYGLKIGYFGAGTGAAAALVAAAGLGDEIHAIVSRGGRPDLARRDLLKVRAPTLLIVGGRDETVICLNGDAFTRLRCEKAFRIVPEATHLFDEPGKLEQVAQASALWFGRHLGVSTSQERTGTSTAHPTACIRPL